MDLDGDGRVSEEELKKAYDTLKKAKQQEDLDNKINKLNNISD